MPPGYVILCYKVLLDHLSDLLVRIYISALWWDIEKLKCDVIIDRSYLLFLHNSKS